MEKEAAYLIEQLNMVRQAFIKQKDTLAVSIRKDLVKADLKDILYNSNSYEELRNKLNEYIDSLIPGKEE